MARRNESPEDKRRRELVQGFLKDNPINDPNDIQELMKEMMRQVLQGGLDAELDDESIWHRNVRQYHQSCNR